MGCVFSWFYCGPLCHSLALWTHTWSWPASLNDLLPGPWRPLICGPGSTYRIAELKRIPAITTFTQRIENNGGGHWVPQYLPREWSKSLSSVKWLLWARHTMYVMSVNYYVSLCVCGRCHRGENGGHREGSKNGIWVLVFLIPFLSDGKLDHLYLGGFCLDTSLGLDLSEAFLHFPSFSPFDWDRTTLLCCGNVPKCFCNSWQFSELSCPTPNWGWAEESSYSNHCQQRQVQFNLN